MSDRRVFRLLRQWLAAGVMDDGHWRAAITGTPQGGVISPLCVSAVLARLGLEFHPEKTRIIDLSHGRGSFDFLGCHLRKRMSGPLWERTRRRVYFLQRRPSQRAMSRVRARVRALTPRSRCHEDLHSVIAEINTVLRGWAQYFRTGNAGDKFIELDAYVEARLRGLLLKRASSRLRAGRADAWRRPFFEAIYQCAIEFTCCS